MTRLEQWWLQQLLRRELRQGYSHLQNATALYALIREAWRDEFTEENEPTSSAALEECFEKTQVWPFGRPARIET